MTSLAGAAADLAAAVKALQARFAPSVVVPPPSNPPTVNAWAKPSAFGYPDASNTGWAPTGVTLVSTSTALPAVAGAVFDSCDFAGQVLFTANNQVIKRSRVTVSRLNAAAINANGFTGCQVIDTEVVGGAAGHGSYNGIQGPIASLRCNIHNFENAFEFYSGASARDCYVHTFIADYAGAAPHYDGVECGSGSNFTVDHCTIDNDQNQTSAINFSGDFGSLSNITITRNLLRGGGWVIYLDKKTHTITGVTLDNNRFGRTQQWGILADSGAAYGHAPTGNVFDDDNSVAI